MAALHRISTPALDVGYFDDGPRDGAPVILIHGFPDDATGWDAVVGRLRDEPLRLLRPFVRGFGPTRILDGFPVSAETAALGTDILEFAAALGIERFTMVGHDWGARAVYTAAMLAPERIATMIALSTGYGANTPVRPLDSLDQTAAFWYQWYFNLELGAQALATRRRDVCRYLWQTWSPTWNFPQAEFEAIAPSFDNPQFLAAVLHFYRHRWGNAPTSAAYVQAQARCDAAVRIDVDTVMVQGLADACNLPASSRLSERYYDPARYRRIELEGVGHFPQHEAPEAVATAIREAVSARR